MDIILLSLLITLMHPSEGKEMRTASIFSDNMVIQQGINAPVWGWSEPGTEVKISFAGTSSSAFADESGKWIARMPQLEAGGPFDMKITGPNTIIYRNVMVGEVWLASGQSNMEWKMSSGIGPNTEEEIAGADYPMIRFINIPKETSIIPLKDIKDQQWVVCSPDNVRDLSAVAYFFSRQLHMHQGNAVGIISSSWGATSAEAWISREMLATHPDFRDRILSTDSDSSAWNSYVRSCLKAEQERELIAHTSHKGIDKGVMNPGYDDSDWKICGSPADMPAMNLNGYWGLVWLRKEILIPQKIPAGRMILNADILARDVIIYINGKEVIRLANPAKSYSIDIAPGILKQGSNVLSARLYVNWGSAHIGSRNNAPYIASADNSLKIPLGGKWKFNHEIEPKVAQWQDYYNKPSVLFNARIAPLIPFGIKGVIWYQGENNAGNGYQYRTLFPLLIEDWRVRWQLGYFPFLYVQLPNYMERQTEPVESDWAELREAQLMTLRYPNTGMVVTIDIGDPADIHPRNKLDVGKRLCLLARKKAYGENIVSSGPLFRSYSAEGNRMRIRFSETGSGITSRNDEPLKGFAIAGEDGKFHWADAVIDGDEVIVSSPEVQEPTAVRYSWENNPAGNLINAEGLPASPFRTDSRIRNKTK